MTWARLDDQAHSNPKLLALSDAAWRMWGNALIYCQRELTDGFIPAYVVETFGVRAKNKRAVVDELCEPLVAGKGPLWHRVDGGYQIHDFLDWNEGREEVIAQRKAAQDRKEKWRASRVGTRSGTRSATRPETRSGTRDSSGSRPRTTSHDPQEVSTEQKPQSAPVRALLTRFDERHLERFGAKAGAGGGKDAKRLADLWRRRQGDPVTVEALIDAFFQSNDPFVLTAGFSVGVFVSQVPKLVTIVAQEQQQPAEHWKDECLRLKHDPPCEHEPAHYIRMEKAKRVADFHEAMKDKAS